MPDKKPLSNYCFTCNEIKDIEEYKSKPLVSIIYQNTLNDRSPKENAWVYQCCECGGYLGINPKVHCVTSIRPESG
jgi:hypothetical protein